MYSFNVQVVESLPFLHFTQILQQNASSSQNHFQPTTHHLPLRCPTHQLATLCVRAVPPEYFHDAHMEDGNICMGRGTVPDLRSRLRATVLQPARTRAGHRSQGARCYRPEVGG